MYDLIVVKPRRTKLEVFIYIMVLILSIVVVSLLWTYKVKCRNKIKMEFAVNVEQQAIEQERLALEREKRRKDVSVPFTDEQINSILNICDSMEKRVFLTFDDGPSNTVTPLILDLLKEKNIKATFFLLGNRVRAYSDLVNRIYNEGHYIGNHGYSHNYGEIYSSVEATLEEYNKTEQILKEVLKNPDFNTRLFRFPGGLNGGKYNDIKHEAKDRFLEGKVAYLDWNALTNDAGIKNPTRETILSNLEQTSSGKNSIVLLMHDSANKILTYETLPEVIQFFTDRGYKFCNIYDIL